MSMLLFAEQPVVASKTLSRVLGLQEAVVLQQINYWIEINKKTGRNFHQGRYWTYNTLKAWHKNDFDYIGIDTLKRIFAKLEKEGFLIVGNFNKDARDRTKWYSINDEKLLELHQKLEKEKQEEARMALQEAEKESTPVGEVQNALTQGVFPSPKCGKYAITNVENPPMTNVENPHLKGCKIHTALPEISTETSTEISTETSTEISTETSSILPSNLPSINKHLQSDLQENLEGRKEKSRIINEWIMKITCGHSPDLWDKKIAETIVDILLLPNDSVVRVNQQPILVSELKTKVKLLDSHLLKELKHKILQHTAKTPIKSPHQFLLTALYNLTAYVPTQQSAVNQPSQNDGLRKWQELLGLIPEEGA